METKLTEIKNWIFYKLTFSFPAATTTVTPALVKAAMAELRAVDFEPPTDMFKIAFPARPLAVTLAATTGC